MESFRNFMQGRYGFDKLGLFIIIASIVLSMLSRLFWLPLLNWMAIILDIVFIYRFLSKKEFARQRENRIFLEKFEQAKEFIHRDRKNYNYYRCPVCKTKSVTPKNQTFGYTSKVICPKCKNEF